MTQAASSDAAARADALLAAYTPDRPGLAVLIARGGEAIYERYLGGAELEHGVPVTAATRFHVASVSKQFTAFAAMQLAHQGRLDLDGDIRTWLPAMPDFGTPITVSDLIHHTSGLRDQWELTVLSGTSMDSLIRQNAILAMAARQRGLNFAPGTDFCYSNTGYSLLAEIVATVSGRKFHQYMDEAVFAPLGMRDAVVYGAANQLLRDRAASYGLRPDGSVHLTRLNYSNYGATSLQSTPRDLVKWSREILHPSVFDPALIASLSVPGRLRDGRPLTYAAGLSLDPLAGHRAIGHGGADAGYRSILTSFPDEDVSLAAVSNGAADIGSLAADLARLFLAGGEQPPPTVTPDAATLERLCGYYVGDWGPGFELVAEDGKLVVITGGFRKAASVLADGRFYVGAPSNLFTPRDDGSLESAPLGGLVSVRRPVQRATPSAADLAALGGDYRSEELDVTYTLTPSDTGLAVSSLRSDPLMLVPADEDRFENPSVRLAVVRDCAGRATGFTVATGRVRGLAFRRV